MSARSESLQPPTLTLTQQNIADILADLRETDRARIVITPRIEPELYPGIPDRYAVGELAGYQRALRDVQERSGRPSSQYQSQAEVIAKLRRTNRDLNARAQLAESVSHQLGKHMDGIGRRNGCSIARALIGAMATQQSNALQEIAQTVGFGLDEYNTRDLPALASRVRELCGGGEH